MFKRFILLVAFLIVAFYVYSGIHPTGAEALVDKVQNIFGWGDTEDEIIIEEVLVEELTGEIEELTGNIFTGDDLGLFDAIDNLPTGDTVEIPVEQTPCAEIWEFSNEELGWTVCCLGLKWFLTGQWIRNRVDPGSLCYDPEMGEPYCDKDKEWQEGWFTSGSLIRIDDCIVDPIVVPTQETQTDPTPTPPAPQPQGDQEVQNTQNIINSLFK